jgi:protein-tyrosine phosphatase
MGLLNKLRSLLFWSEVEPANPIVEARILDVPSGTNYRDLGGYDTPHGKTCYRRFVRSATTAYLTETDLIRLERYGVCRVLDLRSSLESPKTSDRFVGRTGIKWLNVPLFDYDLSDPKLSGVPIPSGNYLIDGYISMLSNREAVREIFEFFAGTPKGGAVLFHCAAGMDRTGMCAMLLLGLAEVPRKQIVADYLYSFASIREVDRIVFEDRDFVERPGKWDPLPSRLQAIEFMLDRLEEGYGNARNYLRACGISEGDLDAVFEMLTVAPCVTDGSDN